MELKFGHEARGKQSRLSADQMPYIFPYPLPLQLILHPLSHYV